MLINELLLSLFSVALLFHAESLYLKSSRNTCKPVKKKHTQEQNFFLHGIAGNS